MMSQTTLKRKKKLFDNLQRKAKMKYIKKPIVVEAFQFGIDETPEWFTYPVNDVPIYGGGSFVECNVPISEYMVFKAFEGDIIIKDAKGNLSVKEKNIFNETYDRYEYETHKDYTHDLLAHHNNIDSDIWIVLKDSPTQETVYDVSEIKIYNGRIELIVDRSKQKKRENIDD